VVCYWGFDPISIRLLNSWGGLGFIRVDVYSAEIGRKLRIINVYRCCINKNTFWFSFWEEEQGGLRMELRYTPLCLGLG